MPTPPPLCMRHPRGAGGGVHQRIQQRPVGDGVGAVAHGFGLAVRRRDGAGVEVVAADHDGRFQFALPHQAVDGHAELGALAVAQPADARGQSLETGCAPAPAASSGPAFRRAGTSRAPAGRCGRCLPDRPRAPPSGTVRGLRRTAGGCTRARSRGCRRRARRRPWLGLRADVVAVIERHGARAFAAPAWPRRARPWRRSTARHVLLGIARAQRRALPRATCRWARSRSADRARWSGR